MIPQQGGMPPGMPPGRGAPQGAPGQSAVRDNMSPLNGADRAYMQSRGQSDNMSIKDYIEQVVKVPINAPVAALKAAMQKMGQNATMQGKARNVAAQSPMGGGMSAPPPRPMPQQPGASAQGQSPRGMSDLSKMLG